LEFAPEEALGTNFHIPRRRGVRVRSIVNTTRIAHCLVRLNNLYLGACLRGIRFAWLAALLPAAHFPLADRPIVAGQWTGCE
jgi:hypothetical protein